MLTAMFPVCIPRHGLPLVGLVRIITLPAVHLLYLHYHYNDIVRMLPEYESTIPPPPTPTAAATTATIAAAITHNK